MSGIPTPPPTTSPPGLISRIRAAQAAAAPKVTQEPGPQAPVHQDVKADSSPAAPSKPTPTADSTSQSPEGQAVPYERFKEVNEAKRVAEQRLAQLEADKKQLEDKMAAEQTDRTKALAERLLKGEVDDKEFGPALAALIDSKVSSATLTITAKQQEDALRAQLGTMPDAAKAVVIETMRKHGLSLDEATALASVRNPSLFPEQAAGFNPSLHPSTAGGRASFADSTQPMSWEQRMAQAQGKAAKAAVGLEWMKAVRGKKQA